MKYAKRIFVYILSLAMVFNVCSPVVLAADLEDTGMPEETAVLEDPEVDIISDAAADSFETASQDESEAALIENPEAAEEEITEETTEITFEEETETSEESEETPDDIFSAGEEVVSAGESVSDPGKYVTLNGSWYFKNYRTYSHMFQYFAYGIGQILTEDLDAAKLPDESTYNSWNTVDIPTGDVATGGLLDLETCPSWSESWLCRTFDLSADFTTDASVTLLLGVIDDLDVVYINGHLVDASGFMDGNGSKTLNIPETGGFNYTADDPADQVKFEKSYWEVSRQYTVPTEYLNLGGKNEICIRLYNNNSYGGFYSSNTYAICGNSLAVRAAKNLPTDTVDSENIQKLINEQIEALSSCDADRYAATVHENYTNDGILKTGRVEEIRSLMGNYSSLTVQDSDAGLYNDNGKYVYSATRKITAPDNTVIFNGEINIYYAEIDGSAWEYGNWSRCYSVSYHSDLFTDASGVDTELSYGIYLPPSYYTDTDKTYPVVYLLHGINSTNNSFMNVDHIDSFMDNLIAEGTVMEMIVVMPNSGKTSGYMDTDYVSGKSDSTGPWASHITQEIRKQVDSTYRTIDDAKFRGVTGISMGGWGAVYLGTSNPDIFSSVASHMGALGTEFGEMNAVDCLKAMTDEELAAYDFYFDCGLQDTMVSYADTVAVHEYLKSIGKAHGYDLRNGGHNSAFYMAGMADSMKMHSDHFKRNTRITIADSKITLSESNCLYTGKALEPAVTVQNGNMILTEGTDYTISYSNNTNAGTAVVTVSGIGKYTGSVEKTFVISLVAPVLSSVSNSTDGVTVQWNKVSGAEKYRVLYRAETEKDWKTAGDTDSENYTVTGLTSGTKYTFTVRCVNSSGDSFTSDYDAAGKNIKYLAAGNITSLTNTSKGITVKWKKVKGASGYYVYRKTSGGTYKKIKTIKSGSTVRYSDSSVQKKNGVRYTYSVRPYYGKTMGSYIEKTTVRLTSVSGLRATNVKSKKLTVKWKKDNKTSGYQIQYSVSAKFSSARTVTVKKKSTVAATVSGLKKGKKYYVRIRAYKTISGKNYYSAWKTCGKAVKINK